MKVEKGLPLARRTTIEQQDAKLREAASMYEKHFLRELVKNMRATVPKSGLIQESQAEKIFREQLDEQYVESWGQQGGVGLGDLIYKQMLERFGEQMGIKPPVERVRGPVALEKVAAGTGFRASSDRMARSVSLLFQDLQGREHSVVSPWSGLLTEARTEKGDSVVRLRHLDGFESELRFPGLLWENLRAGPVEAGTPLGTWLSAKQDFAWRVDFRPDAGE